MGPPSGAQRPVRGSEGPCVAIADPSRRDTSPGPLQTAWRTTYGCHHSDAAQQCQWFASSRCRDQAQTTCGGSPVSWPRCAVHGETRRCGLRLRGQGSGRCRQRSARFPRCTTEFCCRWKESASRMDGSGRAARTRGRAVPACVPDRSQWGGGALERQLWVRGRPSRPPGGVPECPCWGVGRPSGAPGTQSWDPRAPVGSRSHLNDGDSVCGCL